MTIEIFLFFLYQKYHVQVTLTRQFYIKIQVFLTIILYIENNIYTKIKVYQILHVFILAVCKSLYMYHELQSVTLDANYLVCIAQTNSIWSQWRKKDPFAWKQILDPASVSTSASFSIKYQFQGNCPCCHGKTTDHCNCMLLHRALTVWFDEFFS